MIYTYPNLGEIPEIPDAGTGVDTRQLHLCITAALELIKGIDDNVNTLASKLGLKSMPMGIIDIDSSATKRQSYTDNMVYEICEKVNKFTCTITELPNTLNELSTDGSDITGSLTALQGIAATAAAVKNNCDEMLSLVDKLMEEHTENFSGLSQDH